MLLFLIQTSFGGSAGNLPTDGVFESPTAPDSEFFSVQNLC